ncbi:MAG TPA: hypothetical protein VF040_13870 [Ktedonobacterales bacterium]
MSWALIGPTVVVLFELLVFVGTVAFIYYFASKPESVEEPPQQAQPPAA